MNHIFLDNVVRDIERVLKETNIKPEDMTVRKYSRNGGIFDGRSLRTLGGFSTILKYAFPDSFSGKSAEKIAINRRNVYVRSLERELSESLYYEDLLARLFKEALNDIGYIKKPKVLKPRKKASPHKRENVALLSDTHFGLNIDIDEVGSNEYDWNIAARRLGKFTEQIATFKIEHRSESPQLRLCLGGDLGQGVIHWKTDAGTELITKQIVGIYSYLIQMVDYLRNYYSKIIIECTPDNHMRVTHKDEGRQTAQKFDSFATPIYTALQGAFRMYDDVKVVIPLSPISSFHVLGHKYGLTHGDTHIDTGNVGSMINIKSISHQILRLNASEKDGKFKVLAMGHVHTPLRISLSDSCTDVVVNGTMSGTDGYSHSRGFFNSISTQTLWEATEDYAVGDFRIVNLDDASYNTSYEEIIKPYDGSLNISDSSLIR